MSDEKKPEEVKDEVVEVVDTVDVSTEDLAEQLQESVDKAVRKYIPEAEKKFRLTNSAEAAQEVKAAHKFANTVKFFNAANMRDYATLNEISGLQAKVLNEGTNADGGYLVPVEFESEVIRFVNENSVIRPLSTVLPMNSLTKNLNALTGDVTVYTPAEQGVITATTPTFAEPVLTALKYAGLSNLTEELLEDSEVELISLMAERFGKAIAKKEQNNFCNGTTAGSKGILQAAGVTTVSLISGTTFTDITYEDLAAMQSALFAVDETEAMDGTFLMSMVAYNALRTSTGTDAHFRLAPPVPTNDAPAMAWGRQIKVLNEFPTTTATATKFVAYADWSNHSFIGDRRGIRVSFTDSHDTNFAKDVRTMKVTKRTAYVTALPTGITALLTN